MFHLDRGAQQTARLYPPLLPTLLSPVSHSMPFTLGIALPLNLTLACGSCQLVKKVLPFRKTRSCSAANLLWFQTGLRDFRPRVLRYHSATQTEQLWENTELLLRLPESRRNLKGDLLVLI